MDIKQNIIILVDKFDNKIGEAEKLKAHQGHGILHRAFTVFLINKNNEILLTKRGDQKPLWPLIWETSCSSHQMAPDEGTITAVRRRLKEELGVETEQLNLLDKFEYKAEYNKELSEHEICWVVSGKWDEPINPNPVEIADFKWQKLETIEQDIGCNVKAFVPWLLPALKILKENEQL